MRRERAASLDEALASARREVDETLRSGGLDGVEMLREFTPAQRVQARIEISGPGLLRGAEGGLDVMGDGSLIPYTGTIRKLPLKSGRGRSAYETLEEALRRG